ncbi:MAG: glycosyltransferase family 2 protein [Patescibacteria group bacterium]
MHQVFEVAIYVFSFIAVFVQIFFLITFFEGRKSIRRIFAEILEYPSITVMVPCYNEESTIAGTVESILALDYPKDKIFIKLIDDGSSDGTFSAMHKFSSVPNLEIIKKENGGKHTALNLGIENSSSDFVACLDADSSVHPQALKRMIPYFSDPKVMAVSPSIIVREPDNIIRKAQKAEYDLSVYVKKMLGLIGGIHVTPGPFSVYRREVFEKIGMYRKAHNTEDMEIAYRMQTNGLKIEQCHDAFAYTSAPSSVWKLYKQRLRWIYGFINNTIDYRDVLFRKKYGHFALFTLPAGVLDIFAVLVLFGNFFYVIGNFIYQKAEAASVVGVNNLVSVPSHFSLFYIGSKALLFIMCIIYALVIFSILMGRKMSEGKARFSPSIIYYIFIYSLIAPFWLVKAVVNTAISKQPAWK